MSAVQALNNLAAAANAAAASLSAPTIETEENPGLRLSNGELVLDYASRLFIHAIPGWVNDSTLEHMDIVNLRVDVHPSDDAFYLVHRPGTKKCSIIFPSHGGVGNCDWRIQELKEDDLIESFLRSNNAWS